jgi:hypothetical protein
MMDDDYAFDPFDGGRRTFREYMWEGITGNKMTNGLICSSSRRDGG